MKNTPYQARTTPINATLGTSWVVELPCSIETIEVSSKMLLKVSARWEDGTKTILWTTFQFANFVDDKAHQWPESLDLTLYYRSIPDNKEFSAILFMDWFTPCFATAEEALRY